MICCGLNDISTSFMVCLLSTFISTINLHFSLSPYLYYPTIHIVIRIHNLHNFSDMGAIHMIDCCFYYLLALKKPQFFCFCGFCVLFVSFIHLESLSDLLYWFTHPLPCFTVITFSSLNVYRF